MKVEYNLCMPQLIYFTNFKIINHVSLQKFITLKNKINLKFNQLNNTFHNFFLYSFNCIDRIIIFFFFVTMNLLFISIKKNNLVK